MSASRIWGSGVNRMVKRVLWGGLGDWFSYAFGAEAIFIPNPTNCQMCLLLLLKKF